LIIDVFSFHLLCARSSATFLISQLITGATVAPVTLSIFGTNTMAGPARDLRMPSVANAGKDLLFIDVFAFHLLSAWSSAPFLLTSELITGATVAPVTQAMFGTNTMAGPDRDPRMPSLANAGKVLLPLSQIKIFFIFLDT
jgi:hypothetical protein